LTFDGGSRIISKLDSSISWRCYGGNTSSWKSCGVSALLAERTMKTAARTAPL